MFHSGNNERRRIGEEKQERCLELFRPRKRDRVEDLLEGKGEKKQ